MVGEGVASGWDVEIVVSMAETRCLSCHSEENYYKEVPEYSGSVRLGGSGSRTVRVVGLDQAGGSTELFPETVTRASTLSISHAYPGRLRAVVVYVDDEWVQTR